MNIDTLKKEHDKVMTCDVKDSSGLNDYQKLPDHLSIAIPQVGIERFRIPLLFKSSDGQIVQKDAEASMYVNLKEGKTGVNMSRFCQILQKEAFDTPITHGFIENILTKYRYDLRDFENEDPIKNSFIKFKFQYPTKQKSLKSDNWGWQYYNCEIEGIQNTSNQTFINLTLDYEYSSTCPCSLSVAKQYEQDFRDGKTNEGTGIASAHSQRSNVRTTVTYLSSENFWIDDLIQLLRTAIPTETQSLVKRVDEQAFAILNGENPMFVEHVSKRLALTLNTDKRILDWKAKIEHFESLHSHNAVAMIHKEDGHIYNSLKKHH